MMLPSDVGPLRTGHDTEVEKVNFSNRINVKYLLLHARNLHGKVGVATTLHFRKCGLGRRLEDAVTQSVIEEI